MGVLDRRAFLAGLAAALSVGTVAEADSLTRPAPAPTPEPALPGRTFLPQLAGAPFPHASRANGHDYDGKHYGEASSYNDSTVGIYVPSGFRPGARTDLVIHFHGWNNHVTDVFRRYELREQLEGSGLNAVLVVPQGPKDAPDSGDGKLELDADGFARFVADVARFLKDRQVVANSATGKIALSSHSGGYGAVGGILTRGGMNAQITDVLLFDSAYGYLDAIAAWTKSAPEKHLLSLFTDDTSLGNAQLMAMFQGTREYQVLNAASMTIAQLMTREPTFVLTTGVIHDELLQQKHWYELFLRTTALALQV